MNQLLVRLETWAGNKKKQTSKLSRVMFKSYVFWHLKKELRLLGFCLFILSWGKCLCNWYSVCNSMHWGLCPVMIELYPPTSAAKWIKFWLRYETNVVRSTFHLTRSPKPTYLVFSASCWWGGARPLLRKITYYMITYWHWSDLKSLGYAWNSKPPTSNDNYSD